MTKNKNHLAHALRHADRLYQDWKTYRPKKGGTNQRYPYFIRKMVKYCIDNRIEYWHWAGWLCWRYRKQVYWISPPRDKYVKVYVPFKDLTWNIPGYRIDQIVPKLKDKGLIK